MLTIQNPSNGSSQQTPGLVIISGYKDEGTGPIAVTLDGVAVEAPVTFTSAGLWQTSAMVMQNGPHTIVATRGTDRAQTQFTIGASASTGGNSSTPATNGTPAASSGSSVATFVGVVAIVGLGAWWLGRRG